MNFGEKIRLLRGLRNYNQAGLAKKCNVSQTTLSNIETGKLKKDIPQDKKLRIAAALGKSVEEIDTTDVNDLYVSNNQKGGAANIAHLYHIADDDSTIEAYKQLVATQEARITYLEAQVTQLMAMLKH
jgi:transcriptional regulator with XRE-family HTH domain